ncbi:MAG: type IV pili twitching motility protein PilT [Parcubacteria group bacterium CG_4_9_14_0_2_um_filter_35_11]|nr:MAG: type IV pili twitching motility protein PilT [Parcubacteria group bacterium CG07_land_8_20_14_0_80_35_11]PJC47489.1 MAG: type IV pili twitching motility protein PilT [Parcubacteria group bacterium CG_4_9_14_0_2_um_filter_35_11]
MNYSDFLARILEKAISLEASDIHFSVARYPTLRVDGKLTPLEDEKFLDKDDSRELAFLILGEENKEKFLQKKELDFSFEYKDKARFRVNTFFQRGVVSASLRLIHSKIKTIEELNLPRFLHTFAKLEQGFLLLTGPAGHGKSTTLAAIIDEINHARNDHIITIEDPIEYIFIQDKAIVDQREVGSDTVSFHRALRSTLRQDPDVIMLGEMRDYESIAIALTAAETGHLVFSTLHTNSASQTVDRIIDIFPADQQEQVRAQLASTLKGVISQRLLTRIEGGRIPACEIMTATPAISNIIREKRTHELDMVIATSSQEGMISLNSALKNLILQKEITFGEALKYSLDPKDLRLRLRAE